MSPVQTVLLFLAEAVADPSGPQAAALGRAIRSIGFAASGAANVFAAIRRLRHRQAPTAPACETCRTCPAADTE
ncbi:hypothetical protein [Kitasatospora sp. NPDC002040]|uniref:hypothetical protein n=1 Tax=Kitasatospora sp. NPDC002040 TaxID=3154661 RepID=UPI00332A8F66